MKRFYIFLFLLITHNSILNTHSAMADTITTKDGRELKGIVVEDYKDRVTFSTADGEVSVMKLDMAELRFDTEEDNLIKLAEQYADRKNYTRAYVYYERASKINPNSKRARDGLVFLQGYIFRQDEVRKEEAVERQQDLEKYGAHINVAKSYEDEARKNIEELKSKIGIRLNMNRGLPEIESIDKRSPSYEAGMRRSDILVAIWGKLTGYMSLKEISDILLEKGALEIKCMIERNINITTARARPLGASFSMEFDGMTVSEVKEDSASSYAGLKKDDLVVSINGQSTRYMPLKEALDMIKGSKNKKVLLTIRRELLLWRKGIT